MTEAENLARLSAAATQEADDIRYYSGGSPYNASEAKYHAELARLHRSGRLVLLTDGEYICKCGLRVEPHRCPDTKGDF